MADRIGVINKGELVVVAEKSKLMRRLGKRELQIVLRQPLEKIPDELAGKKLALSKDGTTLTYSFDVASDETGIAPLLAELGKLGIDFKDLHSKESSLEEIFVNLVHGAQS
ncbi:hypothetical protein BH11MYX2_BH11MYX2_13530 [soil metagenome]